MKHVFRLSIFTFCLFCFSIITNAQKEPLSDEYKKETIENLCKLMNDYYVHEEVAKKTEVHLKKQLKDGHFKEIESIQSFADALTKSVQTINKDKHMRIRKNRPRKAAPNTPEAIIEDRIYQINRERSLTAGFNEVKKMEGNVGYLDLRAFQYKAAGAPIADNYMKLISTSDAIIIDLRKNGGGNPEMVQYLCSYFFNKKVHLNSLYFREGDRTIDFWTLDKVNGEKMPEVPLFVLTSDYTFSGAEEFSYNMQTQKRATLVGQTSGGGANPGGSRPLNGELSVFIPTGMAINPITKTSWEGVGVIPEVPTKPEETLDKAHELAKIAAEEFRTKNNKKYTSMLVDLHEGLEKYDSNSSDEKLVKSFKKCIEGGVIEEWEINVLGYNYLMEKKNPKTAEAIFKTNTVLFPESANVFDSYAEVLAMKGDLKNSIANYKKAVELGKKNDDPQLGVYIDNLERVKKQMAKEEKP